jgi:predicted acyltransferase
MSHSSNSTRLISLDAFRGAVIVAMILVNSPGTYRAVYSQLRHAEWNGWTYADWVFPFFLFVVGVSTTLSITRRKSRGEGDALLERSFIRRFVILFGLGLFVGSYPIFHASTLRIPGVLQRIALCYLFTSYIVLRTGIRAQIFWAFGILVFYWLMLELVPVPGIGAGVLEPGRNFAAWFDSLLLDKAHMWSHYETWDPEGIASTLPAISSTLFGALTGHWLLSSRSGEEKTIWMFVAGQALVVLGVIFSIQLPINKGIWTSSYVVFTVGWALTWLAVFYWLIDVRGYVRWAKPFTIFGMNAITVYVLSEILDTTFRFIRFTDAAGADRSLRAHLFRKCFEPLMSLENASLCFAVAYVLLMFLMAWFMWRKRWFVKI